MAAESSPDGPVATAAATGPGAAPEGTVQASDGVAAMVPAGLTGPREASGATAVPEPVAAITQTGLAGITRTILLERADGEVRAPGTARPALRPVGECQRTPATQAPVVVYCL